MATIYQDSIDKIIKDVQEKDKLKKDDKGVKSMGIRVKYTFNNETGNYLSKPFLAVGRYVVVTISKLNDEVKFIFSIVSQDTNEVIVCGEADTFINTQKLAKRALQDMGVVFDQEVRNK